MTVTGKVQKFRMREDSIARAWAAGRERDGDRVTAAAARPGPSRTSIWPSRARVAAAISSTAWPNASALCLAGVRKPLTFRTYCKRGGPHVVVGHVLGIGLTQGLDAAAHEPTVGQAEPGWRAGTRRPGRARRRVCPARPGKGVPGEELAALRRRGGGPASGGPGDGQAARAAGGRPPDGWRAAAARDGRAAGRECRGPAGGWLGLYLGGHASTQIGPVRRPDVDPARAVRADRDQRAAARLAAAGQPSGPAAAERQRPATRRAGGQAAAERSGPAAGTARSGRPAISGTPSSRLRCAACSR